MVKTGIHRYWVIGLMPAVTLCLLGCGTVNGPQTQLNPGLPTYRTSADGHIIILEEDFEQSDGYWESSNGYGDGTVITSTRRVYDQDEDNHMLQIQLDGLSFRDTIIDNQRRFKKNAAVSTKTFNGRSRFDISQGDILRITIELMDQTPDTDTRVIVQPFVKATDGFTNYGAVLETPLSVGRRDYEFVLVHLRDTDTNNPFDTLVSTRPFTNAYEIGVKFSTNFRKETPTIYSGRVNIDNVQVLRTQEELPGRPMVPVGAGLISTFDEYGWEIEHGFNKLGDTTFRDIQAVVTDQDTLIRVTFAGNVTQFKGAFSTTFREGPMNISEFDSLRFTVAFRSVGGEMNDGLTLSPFVQYLDAVGRIHYLGMHYRVWKQYIVGPDYHKVTYTCHLDQATYDEYLQKHDRINNIYTIGFEVKDIFVREGDYIDLFEVILE